VIGQAGLGIVGFLAMIPGFLVIAIGVATGSVVVAVVIGGIGVAWIVVASTVIAALSGIYRTALYRFASTGEVPQDFTGVDFQGAFRPRRINPRGMFGGGNEGFNPN
jgi:membrane protein implicated in regulation of membrane protease activity